MSRRPNHLPPQITSLLQRLRRQIRWYVVLEGIAVAHVGLGIAYWLGLALDYLPVLAGANEVPLGPLAA